MMEVDGSIMEGGGQLLRMATTYSAILGEPVKVTNIRATRRQQGIKPQHLTTLKAVAELCYAQTKGLEIGSREIEFYPGSIHSGSFQFDIGTAGSIGLLLQSVAPVAAYAEGAVHLKIIGGTSVKWSPPIPIVQHVVWKALKAMGFHGDLKVRRDGYHPKGGGIVEATVKPVKELFPITGERSQITRIHGLSTCGRLSRHVAERQAETALRTLNDAGYETKVDVATPGKGSEPLSAGSAICLWTENGAYIGADGLGERGKPAESVGLEAASKLLSHLSTGAYVDLHTADNLILPCSLATGTSRFTVSSITLHTLTAVEVARRIARAKIDVKGSIDQPGMITVEGIGIINHHSLQTDQK